MMREDFVLNANQIISWKISSAIPYDFHFCFMLSSKYFLWKVLELYNLNQIILMF